MGSYIWDVQTGETVAVLVVPLRIISDSLNIGQLKEADNYNILRLNQADCQKLRAYLTSVNYDGLSDEYQNIWKKENPYEAAKAEADQFYTRNPNHGIYHMIHLMVRFMEEHPDTLTFTLQEEWG